MSESANVPTADVLIIGGSHAGRAAATTLYRQRHTCLIFDSGEPRNRWPTPIHALPGWEGRQAQELYLQSEAELLETGLVEFVRAKIVQVERQGNECFRLTDAAGRSWLGRKLLIAMGKRHVYPDITGFNENHPQRIFHCMFTFGYERRGLQRAALIADGALSSPQHFTMVVNDVSKFVNDVTVYTNGRLAELAGMSDALASTGTGTIIDDRKIAALDAGAAHDTQVIVSFRDGSEAVEDFLVHQPGHLIYMRPS